MSNPNLRLVTLTRFLFPSGTDLTIYGTKGYIYVYFLSRFMSCCKDSSFCVCLPTNAFSTYGILRRNRSRRLYNRSRVMLFVTMVIMFALSTIYWVMSVVVTFLVIRAWFSELDPATHSPPNWLPMFNAVLLVNVSTISNLTVSYCDASRDLTCPPN